MKVNCEFREFAKSDGMPVYTIVGEVLLDNLDQLLGILINYWEQVGGGGILCSEYVRIPAYRHSANWCLLVY